LATGQTNVAIGLANVPWVNVHVWAKKTPFDDPLSVTRPAFADELAARVGFIDGESAKSPVIIFRGLLGQKTDSSQP